MVNASAYIMKQLNNFKVSCHNKCDDNLLIGYAEIERHYNIDCPKMLIKCPFRCVLVKDLIKDEVIAHIEDECPNARFECSDCGSMVTRKNLDSHNCEVK
jgi:hypothetical protein